jgi:anti-anti-sigma factor
MPTTLQHLHSEIIDATVSRLVGRRVGVHAQLGQQVCRRHVELAFDALEADLQSGQFEAVRAVMQTIVDELAGRRLNFSDLRFFVLSLRSSVRAAVTWTSQDDDLRARLDDWFFELLLVCTMRFVAQRDTALQEQTAKLEVEQLESRLAEVQGLLAEKTELLELIRQASTPIAPVVQGILVVPMVGVFDAVRAENLTEKLLHEVTRLRARAAILDISGVPMFDTAAAQLILRLVRAVRLLGTEVFLVGMSPDNARTIVQLGIDLAGIGTLGTLQDGLARALKLQRLKIAPA